VGICETSADQFSGCFLDNPSGTIYNSVRDNSGLMLEITCLQYRWMWFEDEAIVGIIEPDISSSFIKKDVIIVAVIYWKNSKF